MIRPLRHTNIGKTLCLSFLVLFIILFVELIGGYVIFNSRVGDPLSDALERYHTEDLYFWLEKNSRTDEAMAYCDDIVLVDISALHDRQEIAQLFEQLSQVNARGVVLDVIFPPLSTADNKTDSSILASLRKIDNLVLATNHYKDDKDVWRVERSFFADSLDATEASAWLEGKVVRTTHKYDKTKDGEYIPTLGWSIASLLDAQVGDDNEEMIIGYVPKSWYSWHVGKENFDTEFLREKVLVIGDSEDLRDYHEVPALSGGRSRESGVTIHIKIALNYLLSSNLQHLPSWLDKLIQALLLWLLCLLFVIFDCKRGFNNFIQLLLQLLVLVFVVLLGWLLFSCCNVILSLDHFLIGLLIAPYSTDLVMSIYKYINLKILNKD